MAPGVVFCVYCFQCWSQLYVTDSISTATNFLLKPSQWSWEISPHYCHYWEQISFKYWYMRTCIFIKFGLPSIQIQNLQQSEKYLFDGFLYYKLWFSLLPNSFYFSCFCAQKIPLLVFSSLVSCQPNPSYRHQYLNNPKSTVKKAISSGISNENCSGLTELMLEILWNLQVLPFSSKTSGSENIASILCLLPTCTSAIQFCGLNGFSNPLP